MSFAEQIGASYQDIIRGLCKGKETKVQVLQARKQMKTDCDVMWILGSVVSTKGNIFVLTKNSLNLIPKAITSSTLAIHVLLSSFPNA
jgi:CheY-specific phosphatase CheX